MKINSKKVQAQPDFKKNLKLFLDKEGCQKLANQLMDS